VDLYSVEVDHYDISNDTEEVLTQRYGSAIIGGVTYYLHKALIQVPGTDQPALEISYLPNEGSMWKTSEVLCNWQLSQKGGGGYVTWPAFPSVRIDLINEMHGRNYEVALTIIEDEV